MILDEGFEHGNAEIRLGQLAESLTRLARTIVGIRLHAEDLSVEQGVRFFREEAYQDAAGVWTIGYGHTAGVKEGDTIKEPAAAALLQKDIAKHQARAERHVGSDTWSGLNQGQRDMLTEKDFNVGLCKFPKFTQAVVSGDWMTASNEYKRHYTEAGTGDKIPMDRRNKAFFSQYIEPMLIDMAATAVVIPSLQAKIIIEEENVSNEQSNSVATLNNSSTGITHGTHNPYLPAQDSLILT